MTKLLEEAINKAKKMPVQEQNDIAAFILDEVAWDHTFEHTQSQLKSLGNKALQTHRAGKTKDLAFDK